VASGVAATRRVGRRRVSQPVDAFGAVLPAGSLAALVHKEEHFPQQEVLENEVSFSTKKRPTASAADYLAINGLWSSLGFDNVIMRIAIRAVKMHRRASVHHTLSPSPHALRLPSVLGCSFSGANLNGAKVVSPNLCCPTHEPPTSKCGGSTISAIQAAQPFLVSPFIVLFSSLILRS
jgi:hypothetical protein